VEEMVGVVDNPFTAYRYLYAFQRHLHSDFTHGCTNTKKT